MWKNIYVLIFIYRNPSYEKVRLQIENDNYNTSYGLFHYFDTQHEDRAINGYQPIIFLPGNGGDYKHGRYLGSWVLNIYLDKRCRIKRRN